MIGTKIMYFEAYLLAKFRPTHTSYIVNIFLTKQIINETKQRKKIGNRYLDSYYELKAFLYPFWKKHFRNMYEH